MHLLNKKTNKNDNFLLYRPTIIHEHWIQREGVIYLIFHHDKFIERLASWLVKSPTVTDLKLDELGTKVWQLIDGEHTVYDIGQSLLTHYGKDYEPVYPRLIMYLRYLNKKGVIKFERPLQGESYKSQ